MEPGTFAVDNVVLKVEPIPDSYLRGVSAPVGLEDVSQGFLVIASPAMSLTVPDSGKENTSNTFHLSIPKT